MIQFSVDDVRDPVRLERTLRQIVALLDQSDAGPSSVGTIGLAKRLASAIRNELQVNGSAPLNLQSLLPLSNLSVASHSVPLLKLTGGGVNGSITFNSSGIITAYVDPT